MIHVQTKGSHWFIDNMRMRYMRVPLVEGPREEPYLTMSEDTVLEDSVWHPMVDWHIHVSDQRLRIGYKTEDGETEYISAPNAIILSGPTT